MDTIKGTDLRLYWSKGIPLVYKGKAYRVGKMSYGDYFLEPGKPQGETKPFNRGTKWTERIEKTDVFKITACIR